MRPTVTFERVTYKTVPEALAYRASDAPDEIALIVIEEDGTHREITAAEMHQQALDFAGYLREKGVGEGDLVVTVMGHRSELFTAFLAPIYLGAVPSIFPYPTDRIDLNMYMSRVQMMVQVYGIKVVVTEERLMEGLGGLLEKTGCLVIDADEVNQATGSDVSGLPVEVDEEQTMFIQNTSGTTGMPKGVMLSHKAVLNQVSSLRVAGQVTDADVIVSWLPLYHDMGLIGSWMMPLVLRNLTVMMSPVQWVRSPAMMLQAISQYGGTMSWMPNFAYVHLARAVRKRDMEGVDLSTWRFVLNGSEPVRNESHQVFYDRFKEHGFSETALVTGYGMAETVLAVTISPPYQRAPVDTISGHTFHDEMRAVPTDPDAPDALPIVSSGVPLVGTELRIVDEAGSLLGEREIGRIQLKSHSLFKGYYAMPDLTKQHYTEDGWFNTGDLGYLFEGQLYVIGREKDLIIVGGKNIYPHEIEEALSEMAALRPGRTVAFGVEDPAQGTEKVIVVAELREEATDEQKAAVERDMRAVVNQGLGVTLGDVRLVDKRWVIKTPSGKLARNDNRKKYIKHFVKRS